MRKEVITQIWLFGPKLMGEQLVHYEKKYGILSKSYSENLMLRLILLKTQFMFRKSVKQWLNQRNPDRKSISVR